MNINHILVVIAEPESIFLEILFKYFISTHFKKNKKKNNYYRRYISCKKRNKKK